MPMGIPILTQWANDYDVAHLEAETVPMNLIWSESAQWLLSIMGGANRQTDGQTDGGRTETIP